MHDSFELWGKRSRTKEEELFLEGPSSRLTELWRALKIFAECIRGFRTLHFVGPCVTVFGSARFPESNKYYHLAREVSAAVGKEGFTIMTGGGPGIMEAANRGAKEAGAYSVGCNIKLPREQKPNQYLDRWVDFNYFFVRKFMLIKYSYAFIVMPGGFGTLDELFETLTLIQTGKIKHFPVIIMGRDYWEPAINFIENSLIANGTISESDHNLIELTDSVDDALKIIRNSMSSRFGSDWKEHLKNYHKKWVGWW
ncbi:MAG: TIGR00730 family Rossman fold protein [Candidatus Dadabacteria bacterium]|nr:MAG: TIGR00730 family Rossman fold protein [Candidatus Dadabacteria bacterium]